MPSTLTISGPTFTNVIARAMPTIPALQTLAYFGTSGDGINTNRASGPAISILSGAPVYSANYVSLGLQSGRQDVLETNNPRTAGVLASGWTYAFVGRATIAGNSSCTLMGELNGTPVGSSYSLFMAGGTGKLISLYANATRASIATTKATNDWHFIAASYTGGAAGTWTIYTFTDNTTTGNPATYVAGGMATGAQSPHLGSLATDTVATGLSDMAFAMVTYSVLNAATLSQIAASVRSSLAQRGITC